MAEYKALLNWKVKPEEEKELFADWPANVERVVTGGLSNEELTPLMEDVDVLVGIPSVELVESAPKLKLIIVLGHGLEFLLKPELNRLLLERDVMVSKALLATIPIAEHVIMSMIALTKRTFKLHENLAYRGNSSPQIRDALMRSPRSEVQGGTVGILGFGGIGQEVAKKARAFDMTIGAIARRPELIDKEAHGVSFAGTLDDLETFLPRCDYVVLTLPNTPQTRDVMNEESFSWMKDNSYIINIARGSLIDEKALFEALRSGKLAGAAIDPWREHNRREDNSYPCPYPIHHFNVIMTPKCSGTCSEKIERGKRFAVDNIRRFAEGKEPLHAADISACY